MKRTKKANKYDSIRSDHDMFIAWSNPVGDLHRMYAPALISTIPDESHKEWWFMGTYYKEEEDYWRVMLNVEI